MDIMAGMMYNQIMSSYKLKMILCGTKIFNL